MREPDSCLRPQSSRHTAVLLESNQKRGVIFPHDTGIVVLPTENLSYLLFLIPPLPLPSSSSVCLSQLLSLSLSNSFYFLSQYISISLNFCLSQSHSLSQFLNLSLSISLFLSCINLSKTIFQGWSQQSDSSGRSRSHFLSLF